MNKFNVIVGIDVSKTSLAVCLAYQDKMENFTVGNNVMGLSDLINKLQDLEKEPGKVLICCENTGHYSEKLSLVASGEGFFVWVVAPIIIANYEVKLRRTKTDPADAIKIKDFAFAHQHLAEQYHIPDPKIQQLTNLFKCRKHFLDDKQRNLNYLHSLTDSPNALAFCIESIKSHIAILNKKIAEVEKAIMALIAQNPEMNRKYHLLMTIPGIGPVNAQRFLFITECFQKFKDWRKLACYIGSAPFKHESGTSIKRKPKTSKKRNRQFKADLNQGITSAATRKGQFYHEFYLYRIEKNQEHLKIINQLINLVLKIAFVLIKNDTEFNKELFLNQKKSWSKIW